MSANLSLAETRAPTLPHSIEAEQDLLGAIMLNNLALYKVSGFLRGEHFFEPVHGRIFDKSLDLIAKGSVADPVTLIGHFRDASELAEMGGANVYLARLAASATTVINVEHYGRFIYDCYQKRCLISISEGIGADAMTRDTSSAEQIDNAIGALMELTSGPQSAIATTATAFEGVLEEIDEVKRGSARRLSTGIRSLDRALNGGLRPGQLAILAGRPGMGKTTLAINIAANAAKRGEAGLFFSLEMTAKELMVSLVSRETAIDSKKIITADLTDYEIERIKEQRGDIAQMPLFIDDSGSMAIDNIISRAHSFRARHDIGFIVVDHLQRMRTPYGLERTNRTLSLGQSVQGLKNLAKALDIPVIALSQLNRGVEERNDKRPLLSDLRESGEIEQEADVVALLYRHEYYLKKAEAGGDHDLWAAELEKHQNVAELEIAKNRSGQTGRVKLYFKPENLLFAELY